MANEVATAVSNTVFGQFSMLVTTAEEWVIDVSASWWVMVPSISLYPNAGTTDPGAAPIDTVVRLHALIMPITLVVAVGGMLWNGLLMVLSRKPAPLVNVLRGLWNTALWSAVGVFGTQLLLAGSDAFSRYVITSALKSVGNPSLGKRLSVMIVPVTGQPGGLPVGIVILVGGIAMICAFIQAVLMLFRDGSVLILAACTPLAASGSFTNATNGWKNKILSWQSALIFYKPIAALVYAAAIWLTGENSSSDPRVLLFGLAMMIVALVALPVLLRFFTWTIGSLQSGGGGLGLLATAGAAGMHAAASLRGVGGGSGANEHARYLNETFRRGGSGPRGSGGSSPSSGPGPSPGPGSRPGPGPGGVGGPRPPSFIAPSSPAGASGGANGSAGAGSGGGAGGVASSAGAGGGVGGSGAAAGVGGFGAGTAAAGAASSAGGAAGGAASGVAAAGSAAAGPAAPVVAGVVAVTGAAVRTGKAAAGAAASAASDATDGG